MSAPPEVPRGARPAPAATGYKFWVYGEKRAVLRDAYHTFLRMPWPVSLGLIMLALFAANVIVHANLQVTAAMSTITAEGKPFYQIRDLSLVRDHMAGMRRGWSVMHVIDEQSPLYGKDAAALDKAELELECALIGLDDVTMQTVHMIHIYGDKDIRFDHHFVDTIKPLPNGDLLLDLTKFDTIAPDA